MLNSESYRSGNFLRIAVQGQASDVEIIKELLSPWNILFTDLDEADVVIAYKEKPVETKKTIVIPSKSNTFMKTVREKKSKVVKESREPVSIAAGLQTVLTITPQTFYHSDRLIKPETENSFPTAVEDEGNSTLLTLDVVDEYYRILSETLNAEPSLAYSLLTGLPISYTRAPKQLRKLFMRRQENLESLTFCDKLPLDALRFILVREIEKLANRKLDKKTWNGKKYALLLTHDVETRIGLLRAKKLKNIESKYDVPTAWYIPSKLYKLDGEVVQELANHGEVGAHDTKHDGKLDSIPERKLTERLIEAREALEAILGAGVKGFRAPLLQHSVRIIHALGKAGYDYDTSIPTWEPRHPKTMKSHGIATIFPLTLEGVTEIPVTLPQDHQLMHVLGLSPKEVIREWTKIICTIKEIGGLCTILVHPDYELAETSINVYEELVSTIASDDEASITVPSEIARSQNANPD